MSFLVCNHCGHKNQITSERVVFCEDCQKKLAFNFTDWKQHSSYASFDFYMESLDELNIKALEQKIKKDQLEAFLTTKTDDPEKKLNISRKSFVFALSIAVILLIFFVVNERQNDLYRSQQTTSEKNDYNYLQDLSWHKETLNEELSLTLPFNTDPSYPILPERHHCMAKKIKSKYADISGTFSITIEEIEPWSKDGISKETLVDLKDEYMRSPGTEFIEISNLEHTVINNYDTYMENGLYVLNGCKYQYDNYTLIGREKSFKVIVSYLDNDILLSRYADVISKSLFSNKMI